MRPLSERLRVLMVTPRSPLAAGRRRAPRDGGEPADRRQRRRGRGALQRAGRAGERGGARRGRDPQRAGMARRTGTGASRRGLWREMARRPWDVVHVQCYHTLVAPLAMLRALTLGIPYVVTFHGGGHSSELRNRSRGAQRLLLRPLLRRARRLVAVARFEIEQYGEELGAAARAVRPDPERHRPRLLRPRPLPSRRPAPPTGDRPSPRSGGWSATRATTG